MPLQFGAFGPHGPATLDGPVIPPEYEGPTGVECTPEYTLDDLDEPYYGIPPLPVPDGEDEIEWRTRHTNHPPGEDPSDITIHQLTVRMEEHPDFLPTLARARAAGFDVGETSGDPYVATIEVVDPNGDFVRQDRVIRLPPERGYYILEHEMNHIEQLTDTERFPEGPPPLNRVIEHPDGSQEASPDQTGVLTAWERRVMEYHNRLNDYLGFFEHGAPAERIGHAADVVDHERKILSTLGEAEREWAADHFPDLPDLESRYQEAMGEAPWKPDDLWQRPSAGPSEVRLLVPPELAADPHWDPSDVPGG